MPIHKDLKRIIRARMTKTGESYTAARAHIIRKGGARTAPRATVARDAAVRATAVRAIASSSTDLAALAGMSDASVKQKTGCGWERWVRSLDARGADKRQHREIVALVNGYGKTDDWWSQMVAVGYERIKGLRARGQRRDGSYEATKSRTFNVPVATLFDAWADATIRRRWLTGATVKVRTTTAPKSMRLGWNDFSIVAVGFVAKGASKSMVALAHTKVPDRETADRLKQFWSDRLDALGGVLAER